MKKYNFLEPHEEPDDPFEVGEDSKGSLSPAARWLLIIGFVGILLAGGLYIYTTYFVEAPPPASPQLALGKRRSQRPVPPPAAKPPEEKRAPFRPHPVREEPVTSAQMSKKPGTPPTPAQAPQQQGAKEATTPSKGRPAEARAGIEKPTPRAQPTEKRTRQVPTQVEKSTEKAEANAKKPVPGPRTQVEKPAPKALAKVPTPRDTGGNQYALQVASLVREPNALALKNRLEKLGYTPIIRKMTAPITHHRVYAGEFNTREEAERTARKLNVDGFPSTVVTITGGKFAPEAGVFLRLNHAIDLAHNLQQKNYTAKIVSEPTPTPVHQVRVGKYENRTEALQALESLKRKGLEPLIVRR